MKKQSHFLNYLIIDVDPEWTLSISSREESKTTKIGKVYAVISF
jgi:hypothetical protein